jgi:hypothetical protein
MKLSRVFLSLVALLLTLLSSGRVAAQITVPVTLVKASRLLDPRTGNVISPAAVLIEEGKIKEVGSPSQLRSHLPAEIPRDNGRRLPI